jgi:hypothetical protein
MLSVTRPASTYYKLLAKPYEAYLLTPSENRVKGRPPVDAHTDRVRDGFAHHAVLTMEPDADAAAPGAAITVALCGHWDHPPPCPLAPHHTSAQRVGDDVHLRILFATEPMNENLVRQRIEQALSGGELAGPDGSVTRWRLLASRRGAVSAEDTDHVERLKRS